MLDTVEVKVGGIGRAVRLEHDWKDDWFCELDLPVDADSSKVILVIWSCPWWMVC